jgi:hypothetical protein
MGFVWRSGSCKLENGPQQANGIDSLCCAHEPPKARVMERLELLA